MEKQSGNSGIAEIITALEKRFDRLKSDDSVLRDLAFVSNAMEESAYLQQFLDDGVVDDISLESQLSDAVAVSEFYAKHDVPGSLSRANMKRDQLRSHKLNNEEEMMMKKSRLDEYVEKSCDVLVRYIFTQDKCVLAAVETVQAKLRKHYDGFVGEFAGGLFSLYTSFFDDVDGLLLKSDVVDTEVINVYVKGRELLARNIESGLHFSPKRVSLVRVLGKLAKKKNIVYDDINGSTLYLSQIAGEAIERLLENSDASSEKGGKVVFTYDKNNGKNELTIWDNSYSKDSIAVSRDKKMNVALASAIFERAGYNLNVFGSVGKDYVCYVVQEKRK